MDAIKEYSPALIVIGAILTFAFYVGKFAENYNSMQKEWRMQKTIDSLKVELKGRP